jgi:hypothetical protein
MHIHVFKRGDKRRTWLIGCKKKSKNKNRHCFIGQWLEKSGEKRYMIVHDTEKRERRGNAKGKATST